MQNQELSYLSTFTSRIALRCEQPEFWFWVFLMVHVAAWTLVPAVVRENLPMDSIEGAIWGQQLEWGYDKNPFMNGWLTALATALDGRSGVLLYFFCQLSVAASLAAVWLLGKKIMPPLYALAAVLLLEGIQYYNFHAIDFNDNTLELGLWAGAIYCFYHAVKYGTRKDWLLTGVLLGLGMMAKYYTLALVTAMGLFLLRKENRWQLATLPPYLGFSIFLLIMIPHIVWLTQHEYITITYMFDRGSAARTWFNHLFFPAQFVWQQFEAFLPALIIFGLLFLGSKPRATPLQVNRFDKTFLFYVGCGPFILTAILSFIFGIKLRAGWGMPLMSFWTLFLFAVIAPRLNLKKINALLAGIFILMAAMLTGYSISLLDSPDTSSANYPGKEMAAVVTRLFEATYHQPVKYVAGPRWVAGNIAFYSDAHPTVFMEWNKQRTTWIDLKDMQKHGAIFVWEISRHERLPEDVAAAYPALSKPFEMEFNWRNNRHQLSPVKIGVAFLPPR